MAPKFIAPNLDNATPTMLLDEMGKLSLMENQIKKLRGYYKTAYYARMGIKMEPDGWTYEGAAFPESPGSVQKTGDIFIASTSLSRPQRVSTTLLKEKYPEIAAECTVPSEQLTTRFSLAEGVVNPVVNALLEEMKRELGLDNDDD